MFHSLKKKTAAGRLLEERLYEQVVEELANGQLRTGLWAKALANSTGDEKEAKSLYIKYRIQSLKDETELKRQEKKTNKETMTNNASEVVRAPTGGAGQSNLWIHVLVWAIAALILLTIILNWD